MKKILSLVLALTMLFSVAVTVSAEVSLSEYVFKGKGLDPNDDTIYTYTFGKFTGDPDEVGVKVLGNKDYKLSDEALATAKANGGLFGIGLADTNNVISGSTYTVTPYTVTDGVREDGTGKEIDKNMEETVVDVPLQVTNITLTDYGQDSNFTTINVGGKGTITTELDPIPLHEPIYNTDESGNSVATIFGEDMFTADVSRVYSDKSYFYTNVPAEMIGASIIKTPREFTNPNIFFMVKFTLNKTATLYFNNSANSAVKVNGSNQIDDIKYVEYAGKQADAEKYTFDPATINEVGKGIWKIECVVPEGQESQEFIFKLRAQAYAGPMLFIKE